MLAFINNGACLPGLRNCSNKFHCVVAFIKNISLHLHFIYIRAVSVMPFCATFLNTLILSLSLPFLFPSALLYLCILFLNYPFLLIFL